MLKCDNIYLRLKMVRTSVVIASWALAWACLVWSGGTVGREKRHVVSRRLSRAYFYRGSCGVCRGLPARVTLRGANAALPLRHGANPQAGYATPGRHVFHSRFLISHLDFLSCIHHHHIPLLHFYRPDSRELTETVSSYNPRHQGLELIHTKAIVIRTTPPNGFTSSNKTSNQIQTNMLNQ